MCSSPDDTPQPQSGLSDTKIAASMARKRHQIFQDMVELADILNHCISQLQIIIRSHPLLNSTQRAPIQECFDIAQSELGNAKAIIKKDSSSDEIMAAGFKLGAAKKTILYQSHQLEVKEVKNWKYATKSVEVAQSRLRRTEALFQCLSSIFSSERLLDIYMRQDCKDLFDSLWRDLRRFSRLPSKKSRSVERSIQR